MKIKMTLKNILISMNQQKKTNCFLTTKKLLTKFFKLKSTQIIKMVFFRTLLFKIHALKYVINFKIQLRKNNIKFSMVIKINNLWKIAS